MDLSKVTPFYTYNTNKAKQNYLKFCSVLPNVKVYFAVKSNPMKEIIGLLNRSGSGFEVASKNELALLLTCSVKPKRIIFSNPVKIASHIEYAYKKGVQVYSFDSSEEIDKLAKYAPGSSVILRLRVYERGSVFSLKDKFGAEERQAVALAKKAIDAGLHFYGLSFHVGSQSLKLNTWKYALEKTLRVKRALEEKGIEFDVLNLGGGFPYQYRSKEAPTLYEIGQVIKSYLKDLNMKKVFAEPGRYIVANTATLTATIIHRTVRRGQVWLYLDAGTYNALFEAMGFQGDIQYRVEALGAQTGPMQKFVLAGPTCDSIDTITISVLLPSGLQLGDQLLFHDVGAYTNALANSFNGFKPPKVVLKN